MTNRSKQKGTAYESSLLPYIKEFDPTAERRVLSGANDKGDFTLSKPLVLEAKNCKTMTLGQWIKEAEVEAKNLGVPHGVVVHKRRGTTDPAEQFVTMTFKTLLELVYGA